MLAVARRELTDLHIIFDGLHIEPVKLTDPHTICNIVRIMSVDSKSLSANSKCLSARAHRIFLRICFPLKELIYRPKESTYRPLGFACQVKEYPVTYDNVKKNGFCQTALKPFLPFQQPLCSDDWGRWKEYQPSRERDYRAAMGHLSQWLKTWL